MGASDLVLVRWGWPSSAELGLQSGGCFSSAFEVLLLAPGGLAVLSSPRGAPCYFQSLLCSFVPVNSLEWKQPGKAEDSPSLF